MAHCARCGKKKGIFNNRASEYCDECEGMVNAELAELRRKRTEKERLQREQERRQRVDELKNTVRRQLEKGGRAFLYEARFIPVDSSENGVPVSSAFAITHLQATGLAGWEIVGVVPRTSTRTLENKTLGSGLVTYAGGIGGTIDGAYILLKKEISPDWEKDEESQGEGSQFLAAQAAMRV